MNEETEAELIIIINQLHDERCRISELQSTITQKVELFRGANEPKDGVGKEVKPSGLLGELLHEVDLLSYDRKALELIVKELNIIVG